MEKDLLQIDYEQLISHYEGDTDLIRMLVPTFEKRLLEINDEFEVAINDHNYKRVAELAHELRGSASSFFATNMVALTNQLEEASQTEHQSKTSEVYNDLKKTINAFLEELKNIDQYLN